MKSAARTLPLVAPLALRLFVMAALVCCFFSFAAPQAQSASLTEPQIQSILGLLRAFEIDNELVMTVDAILRLPEGEVLGASTACPVLSRPLSLRSRGSDVTSLQNFLIAQGTLAAGNNTGYFGSLTQKALQQWQASKGIVSSGTPATTGYGSTGPKTRAALAQCSGGASTSTGAPGRGVKSVRNTSAQSTSQNNPAPGLSNGTPVAPAASPSGSANTDLSSDLGSLDAQMNTMSSDAAAIDAALSDTPIQQISL